MKIVIATPILFDKSSPFNHLFRSILEGLLSQGHDITRIVAVEDLQDRQHKMGLEQDGIEYVPVLRKKADHSNIITRYLLDSWTNLKMARHIRKSVGQDVLFEDVSYSSWLSVWAAKKRGMQVVAMLQDVWPDNAVQSGLLKEKSVLYRFFEPFQRYVYKKADHIVCISDDMKAFITSKGISQEKITVIYNWGYSDETVDIPWEQNGFANKYALSKDVFYAIYAGNIGRMQSVETVVEAAKLLQEQSDIQFLIVGDGARREAIGTLVQEHGLQNLEMLPMQPSELAVHVYSAAGVNLVSLVKNGTRSALPSKTGVILSCGRPAIFTFGSDSQIGRLIEKAGAGVSVDAADPKRLAEEILRISACTDRKTEPIYGLFRDRFCKSRNVQQYVRVISGEK